MSKMAKIQSDFARILLVIVSLISVVLSTDCEWFHEPQGVISTPNFPNRYPIPLKKCYVIKKSGPKDSKTALVFTQFFLKQARIETYVRFEKPNSPRNSQRVSKTTISVSSNPVVFEVPLNYTVIYVDEHKFVDTNIRVPENLMDVYGFNITYKTIIGKTTNEFSEPCPREPCRFNGMCRTDANMTKFYCDCFEGFYGHVCQYSSRCNEKIIDSRCYSPNTKECQHYQGLMTVKCVCKPGFDGIRCEETSMHPCKTRRCHRKDPCVKDRQKNRVCDCAAGNILVGCDCEDGWQLMANGTCSRATTEWINYEADDVRDVKQFTEQLLAWDSVRNVTILPNKAQKKRFTVAVDKGSSDRIMKSLSALTFKNAKTSLGDPFVILSIISNKPMPVQETVTALVLSCEFRAPDGFEITWYKDGARVATEYGPGNIWLEQAAKTQEGIHTSYLGLDHVQYIDKGRFTCEVRHGSEVRRRFFDLKIEMHPGVIVTPSSQIVAKGGQTVVWCKIRAYYESVAYRWFKNVASVDSLRKQWVEIKFTDLNSEYSENVQPGQSWLVVPSVQHQAEYKCQFATKTFSSESVSYVFPYTNDTLFCPKEEYKGKMWNRTVVGASDYQTCVLDNEPKGEAVRKCELGSDGKPRWSTPDFFDCKFSELYNYRLQILSLARGYQITTAVETLARLAGYISSKKELLTGEGDHILELLHEVLEYDDRLPEDHPEVKDRKTAVLLFLDCLEMTFSDRYAIKDDRFYAKLNDMIPQFVVKYMSCQPPGTEFHYEKSLFEVRAQVFPSEAPPSGYASVLSVESNDGLTVYSIRTGDTTEGQKVVLSLLVFKGLLHDYLDRLYWNPRRDVRNLTSELVNFKVAAKFDNGSVIYRNNEKVAVNFRKTPAVNTTLHCALVRDGTDVVFEDVLTTRNDNITSCESVGSHVFALFVEKTIPKPEVKVQEKRILPTVCAIAGIMVLLLCALSITCTNSCWGLLKCVKLNVCVALLILFVAALCEDSPNVDPQNIPKMKLVRQCSVLVCFAQQILVVMILYIEPDRGFLRGAPNVYRRLSLTWIVPCVLLGTSFAFQVSGETDKSSFWGTVESTVTVSDANFTTLIVVACSIYILVLAEIGLLTTDYKEARLTTLQKGILKRSIVVTLALVTYGFTTTGYVQDTTYTVQSILSVVLALTVFSVYTAYCETDVIYRAVWAHYKKKQEAKSMAAR